MVKNIRHMLGKEANFEHAEAGYRGQGTGTGGLARCGDGVTRGQG